MHARLRKEVLEYFYNTFKNMCQIYVDGYSKYTEPSYPRLEIRMDGPSHNDVVYGYTTYIFEISILIQNKITEELFEHDELVEKVIQAVKGRMSLAVGCPNQSDDIEVMSFGRVNNELDILQTSVSTEFTLVT
jgi:hypothetical protein